MTSIWLPYCASSLFMLHALVGNRSICFLRPSTKHVSLFSSKQC